MLVLALAACGTLTGAAVGAGGGAAIGYGTGYGAGKGALIGTGVGAAAGAIYDIYLRAPTMRMRLSAGLTMGLVLWTGAALARARGRWHDARVPSLGGHASGRRRGRPRGRQAPRGSQVLVRVCVI